jgi:hypothetical protein
LSAEKILGQSTTPLPRSAKKKVLPAFAVPGAAVRGPFGSQRMSLT